MYFYLALADRVVTGGGFTPHGAHNIIEPLALGKPVIVGPAIHTIEYPAAEAIAAGVCFHAETPADLATALTDWPRRGMAFFRPIPARRKTLAAFLAAQVKISVNEKDPGLSIATAAHQPLKPPSTLTICPVM
jgi:3-deoxy-D-manno-octulosonic-acid transferase